MVITKKVIVEREEGYLCDLCGERVTQDGTNISLINHPRKSEKSPYKNGYLFHLHTTCLAAAIKDKIIAPNQTL
jgi:hypothetical protein